MATAACGLALLCLPFSFVGSCEIFEHFRGMALQYCTVYSVHWCFAIFVVNEQNLKQHIQTTLEEGVTKYRRREEMNIEDDYLLKR